jgi:hypothetical protein
LRTADWGLRIDGLLSADWDCGLRIGIVNCGSGADCGSVPDCGQIGGARFEK